VPEGWTAVPHSRIRKIIASRLQESKNTAPHFYLRMSARVDALLALRAQLNASGRVKVSVNDFIVKAAGQALVDVPAMNVVWTEDAVLQAPTADVAVAVASEKGLVTPVIRDVASLSLSGLSAKIKDAVGRANQGKLSTADLQGGTLTVSNLGMFGVEEFDAIINPPQAGILAVGAAVRKPVVGEGDTLEIASVLSLVLSVDHRPVDGTDGARWLARLKELLEDPMQIVV
jgi:pyruvate dehydrogenase E2 component (dihydrolipoamide acetyltransferase)